VKTALGIIIGVLIAGGIIILLIQDTYSSARARRGPLVLAIVVDSAFTWSRSGSCTILAAVQFKTPDGQLILASRSVKIPYEKFWMVETGRLVPVHYNPNKPKQIAIIRESDWAEAEAVFGRGVFNRPPYRFVRSTS